MADQFNTSHVMISYSRRDKKFVQKLDQSIRERKGKTWVDWDDIPPTVDWWQEIEAGIEGARAIVFVISPDSVNSDICLREIEHALKHNKRIIPILYRELKSDMAKLHPALGDLNWIYFRDSDDYDKAFQTLVSALQDNFAYREAHTRILVRAIYWHKTGRMSSRLLRGNDLVQAEEWFDQSRKVKNPQPTALQIEFIKESRGASTRRVQIGIAGAVIVLALLSLFSLIAFIQTGERVDTEETADAVREQYNQLALQITVIASGLADLNTTLVAIPDDASLDTVQTQVAEIEAPLSNVSYAIGNIQGTQGVLRNNLLGMDRDDLDIEIGDLDMLVDRVAIFEVTVQGQFSQIQAQASNLEALASVPPTLTETPSAIPTESPTESPTETETPTTPPTDEPTPVPDTDGDGLPDDSDNCPQVSNASQVDSDVDGSGDACDNDADNDGITDDLDNCIFDANPGQEDTDQDNFGDACDTENNSQDTSADRDGDQIPDIWEEIYFGAGNLSQESQCPSDPSPDDDDCDNDGLSAFEEFQANTDPTLADSDSDGLTDGAELQMGSSATNPDTDNDGVVDSQDACPRQAGSTSNGC